MIATRFFSFYKEANKLIKVLLFILLPVMALLWVLGSLTFIDRLVMFIVGIVVGFILMYFFYPPISEFINTIINILTNINNNTNIDNVETIIFLL